jgi:hypothetical protein
MKEIIYIVIGCFLIFSDAFALDKIKEFLSIDPAQVSFVNADKFLSKPHQISQDAQIDILRSPPFNIPNSNFKGNYAVILDKFSGHFLYRMELSGVTNCTDFVRLIKNSYGKNFIYNIDGQFPVQTMEGSIDINDWRLGLNCSPGFAYMESGRKIDVKKILPRDRIKCNIYNGQEFNYEIYQIDKTHKLLRDKTGNDLKTLIFNNLFIEAETADNKSIIEFDRQNSKLVIFAKANPKIKIFGLCENLRKQNKNQSKTSGKNHYLKK